MCGGDRLTVLSKPAHNVMMSISYDRLVKFWTYLPPAPAADDDAPSTAADTSLDTESALLDGDTPSGTPTKLPTTTAVDRRPPGTFLGCLQQGRSPLSVRVIGICFVIPRR